MESNVLTKIIEYAWVGLFAVVAWIMKKISVHDTGIQLLLQAQEQCDKVRDEDLKRHAIERKELLSAINNHHTVVMGRLDNLCNDIGKNR